MSRFAWLFVAALSLIAISAARGAEKRLDYKQEQAAKDAIYYLGQIEGLIEAINRESAGWKVGDASVPITKVNTCISTSEKAAGYGKNVQTRLDALPADHSKVKPLIERLAASKEALAAIDKRMAEIQGGLKEVLKAGESPQYKVDFDRLADINKMFANPDVITSQPERGIQTLKLVAPVIEERKRLTEKYADLMKQPTAEAKRMREVMAYFDEVYPAFDKVAKAFAASAPGAIDKDLADAVKMGNDAVAGKKFAFFREDGGVAQRLNWAQTKYDILEAMVPEAEATKAAQKRIADTRAQIKEMSAALNDSIIAANRPPADQYRGADAEALKGLVKEKWTKEGNGAEILKHGINSSEWKRETRWEWSSGAKAWEKVDRSRIQGWVVAKAGNDMATTYYINLVKDHMSNDAIAVYFFDSPKEAPSVSRKLLIGNVK